MGRFFYVISVMILTQSVLGNDIFRDLSSDDNDNEENNTPAIIADTPHCLLNLLGEHLLSNQESNMLAKVLIKDKGPLEELKKELADLLKPFGDQNPKLTPEINIFISKVINVIRRFSDSKQHFNWDDLKEILPTIQIFCKQLIDRQDQYNSNENI